MNIFIDIDIDESAEKFISRLSAIFLILENKNIISQEVIMSDTLTNYVHLGMVILEIAIVLLAFILIGISYIKKFSKLSEPEKREVLLKAAKEIILSKMMNAEANWAEFRKAGSAKRSEVISEIYKDFPELKTLVDQDTVIKELDRMIDEIMNSVTSKELLEIIDTTVKEKIETQKAPSTLQIVSTDAQVVLGSTDKEPPVGKEAAYVKKKVSRTKKADK